MTGGNHTQQRLPVFTFTNHYRLIRVRKRHLTQRSQQVAINQWYIAGQHQQNVMPGHGQRCTNTRQWSVEISVIVLH